MPAAAGVRNLDPSQRSIVMAALPKLGWGGDRRVKVENSTLTFDLRYRASRASVDRKTQSNADAVYDGGDADLIDRIRAAAVSVSDAFKGIQVDFPIFAVSRSEERAQIAVERRFERRR